jgi:hypothetical protein
MPEPRSKFMEILGAIGDGSYEEKLSDVAVKLTDHLKSLGAKAKGKMVLTIDFVYDREMFEVEATVKTTEPQIRHPRTLMYPRADGGLSRNNSRQLEAFRELSASERPIRDVPAPPSLAVTK